MEPTLTISLEAFYQLLEDAVSKVQMDDTQKQQLVDSITVSLVSSGHANAEDIAHSIDRIRGVQCTLCKNDKVRDTMSKCAHCKRIVHTQCLNATATCSRLCRDTLKTTK